jgi:hypothetical protein
MNRTRSALACLFLVSVDSHAQTVVKEDAAKGCSGCSVKLTKVTTITPGETAETGLPAHPFNVARDSRGRIATTYASDKIAPRVFGADGKLIKILGRFGKGPGEFSAPYSVAVLPGDSVMIIDAGRRLIFDSNYHLVRTAPAYPLAMFETTLPDGNRVVWKDYDVTSSEIKLELQNPTSAVLRSINIPYAMRPTIAIPTLRLAGSGSDKFWLLMSNEYHVEHWSIDGKKRLSLDRNAPWWVEPVGEKTSPTKAVQSRQISAKRPMSSINALQDDSGRLWILGRVPRNDLPASDTTLKSGEGPLSHPYDRYDTMIEVFDSKTGKLLITQRFSGYFSHLLGNGYLAKLVDDEEGRPVVEIWKADLAGVK